MRPGKDEDLVLRSQGAPLSNGSGGSRLSLRKECWLGNKGPAPLQCWGVD